MALDGTKFFVAMESLDGERLTVVVYARTPGLAAKAAEAQNAGFLAKFLSVRKVGECDRCGTVIFEGQKELIQVSAGILHCGEC
ncbi:MAG: hypothetical protein KDA68_14240 [Planctomycetaceae bacterium]|nr:hypothetical protein [Planctomycetaceae bacterium]